MSGLPPTPEHHVYLNHDETGVRLSLEQEHAWRLGAAGWAGTVQCACRVRGTLSVSRLHAAVQRVAERHAILRTVFKRLPGLAGGVQVIGEAAVVGWAEHDLRQLEPAQQDAALAQHYQQLAAASPALHGGALRAELAICSDQDSVLMLSLPSLLADQASLHFLLTDIWLAYDQQALPSADDTVQYVQFSEWQHELLAADDGADGAVHWRAWAEAAPVAPRLTLELPGEGGAARQPALLAATLAPALAAAVAALAQRRGVTAEAVLLAAWQILLGRWTGLSGFWLGLESDGRQHEELAGVPGPFTRRLPLACQLVPDFQFDEVLQRAHAAAAQARACQDYFSAPADGGAALPYAFGSMAAAPAPSAAGLALALERQDGASQPYTLKLDCQPEAGALHFHYDARVLSAEAVARMQEQYLTVLERAVAAPDTAIADLPLMGERERHALLTIYNDTARSLDPQLCAHDLFEAQAAATPDAPAVLCGAESHSYAEIDARANQLAHHLAGLGVQPDTLVGLCLTRSADLAVAILAVLKAGAAYLPLDPGYPAERLRFMLQEGAAGVVLTEAALAPMLALPCAGARLLCVDAEWPAIARSPASRPAIVVAPGQMAYVIFTSGSTGQPKGVMIPHSGLVNYLRWCQQAYPLDQGREVPVHSSVSFDLTVTSLLAPLTTGLAVRMLPEDEGVDALEQVLRQHADCSLLKITPSHMRLLGAQLADGVPARVRSFVVGGENLLAEHIAFWQDNDAATRIFNEYGPTETVVGCCVYEVAPGARHPGVIPIGRPIINTQLYVLDEAMQPVATGMAGELYIGGFGVGRGYLRRPALTAERYVPDPFAQQPGGARLYRTGDLARHLPDGNIEVIGRIDHQVKVRGFRIELGEIEAALASQDGVGEAVVVARRDEQGEQRLVAYVAGRGELSPALLRGALQQLLPHYMVPAHVVVLAALPLTPNGKIDRAALPEPGAAATVAPYVAPRTPAEGTLAAIWAEVLRLERVGVDDNFFDLGGHSLLATQVVYRLSSAFALELPLRVLFEAPTVAALAARLEQMRQDGARAAAPAIVPVSRAQRLPLSYAQQRLWFLDQMEANSAFYNSPLAVRLNGQLDLDALRRTLDTIVQRHEVLRTSFPAPDGEAEQVVAPAQPLALQVDDLQALAQPERAARMEALMRAEARTPFDLASGPLVRARLLRLDAEQHVFLLTLHHIVSDGWSMGVLVREVAALYTAFVQGQPSPLAPLPVQYADFAHWQRQWLSGEVLAEQLDYWVRQLGDAPPALALPTDRPRPLAQTYRGATHAFAVPPAVTAGLYALGKQQQATLAMTLTAAFSLLLSRYCGSGDICLGTAIANRNRVEIEALIGFFVNTLVMRTRVDSSLSFAGLLEQVRATALDAYAHQDVPFDLVVDALQPERELGHSPLFQVMLGVQNTPMGTLSLPGLQLQELGNGTSTAKFDLCLFIVEAGDVLHAMFEYNTDLFDAATIERMAANLATLLAAVVDQPQRPLHALPVIGATELQRQLVDWNDAAQPLPEPAIHQLFEAQARRAPQAVAVVHGEVELSYEQLDRQAAALAARLRARGVGPDVLVGLCMQRGADLVVAMLAILKAGGAYLPLDPAYPQERLAYMLADAGPALVLAQSALRDRLPPDAEVLCCDPSSGWGVADAPPCAAVPVLDEHLAYVIYTSGSTGKPKGVGISHRAVKRLVYDTRYLDLQANDRVAQAANSSFDALTFEVWSTLLHGARLCVVDYATVVSPLAFAAQIRQDRISVMFITTALMNQFAAHAPDALRGVRQVLFGGEAVDVSAVRTVLRHGAPQRLLHVYGPTECTTFSLWHQVGELPDAARTIPIGRPIGNTRLYVLDADLNPLPVGAVGELYIAGAGLARGYFGQPALSAERFVPDPFSAVGGARMYRSGDLVRYRDDGEIVYVRRIDGQVKIRGFRIELGEIETALAALPEVREAVVRVREDAPGDKRLVAYVVADLEAHQQVAELESEQTSHWNQTFDQIYAGSGEQADPKFDIVGWVSSYDGQPIPADDMREWVEQTVAAIKRQKPHNVLEIGCGTGLLLHRIAPDCERYFGVDLSEIVIDKLGRQLSAQDREQCEIRLFQRAADELQEFAGGPFDTVIINSVAQYFPNPDYLTKVLEQAIGAIGKSGKIFLGDIRHHGLQEPFQCALALAQAPQSRSLRQLRQVVTRNLRTETELLVDPYYFFALRAHLPRIGRIEILPKLGHANNEMTKYRYDVVLCIDEPAAEVLAPSWQNWAEWDDGLQGLDRHLAAARPDVLALRDLPNAWIEDDMLARQYLEMLDAELSVADLVERLHGTPHRGVDRNDLLALAERHGYAVQLSVADSGRGVFHAVLSRQSGLAVDWSGLYEGAVLATALKAYVSQPSLSELHFAVQDSIREQLRRQLPDYMMPTHLVVLEQMPLTPNGKIDVAALPAPEIHRGEGGYQAPVTLTQARLAAIWGSVLRVEQVGTEDNFFEMGGHSLLATQLVSRVRTEFHVEVPLLALFELPTVAALAARIDSLLMAQDGAQELPLVPVGRDGPLVLSHAQQRLWFIDQFEPASSMYNMPIALRLKGELDVQALRGTLQEIVRRHEALRTSFAMDGGVPVQRIAAELPLPLPVLSLSGMPADQRETEARRLAREDARTCFDLSTGPLVRASLLKMDEREHIVLLNMHHIVSDGWSLGILVKEVAALYAAAVQNQPSPLPELPIQYPDFAHWQRQWLSGALCERQLAYWRHQLSDAPVRLTLPTGRPRPARQSHRGAALPFVVSAELTAALNAISQQAECTLFMTLTAAFSVLLSRYAGQDDVCIGTPIANRNRIETEGLIGFFVNTLVLRMRVAPEQTFEQLLADARTVTLGAYANQDVPFEQLVEMLQPERHLSHTPLFQVMLGLQNMPLEELTLPGLTLHNIGSENVNAKFDLTLNLMEGGGRLAGSFGFNTDLFDESTIARMAGHFTRLLEAIVAEPARRLRELEMLDAVERRQLLVEWNDTANTVAPAGTIHARFEARAAASPDSVAIEYDKVSLTYGELNAQANRLAHHLRTLGVGPDVLVGLCVERSLDMIVGLLGILKAGGAYVPLDPAYPADRLAHMLEDAAPAVLLTQQRLLPALPASDVPVFLLDADAASLDACDATNPSSATQAGNLAYVIYTSGSTGKAKGVAVAHGSALNLVDGLAGTAYAQFGDLAGVRVGQNASLSFDASVKQWLLLTRGVTLCPIPDQVRGDGELLAQIIAQLRLDAFDCTPSQLGMLMQSGGADALPSCLLIGGEAIPQQLWEQLKQAPAKRSFNVYGPTEATVDTTVCAIADAGAVPVLGRPIGNVQVYLLDAGLNPVPVGVAGELHIAGAGLARGYLNRGDLTADKFIPNPFGLSGGRMYKSGDLARYLEDGSIEYLGRIDHQVKLRGFRIELGEIEAALAVLEPVREALVLAREHAEGDRRLVAYLVARDGKQLPDADGLRTALLASLPEYMVPAHFVVLEQMPLTPNGKVDRKALPAPDMARSDEGYVAPRTAAEEILAGIWAGVLKLDKVSIHDNFFALGGHSLLATQLVSQIRGAFEVELPLRAVFEAPTVAGLLKRMESAQRGLTVPPVTPVARSEDMPLSFAQQRLWFLDRLEPGSAFYNIPAAVRLSGQLDVAALHGALNEIVRRHEALRTCFGSANDAPLQVIAPVLELALSIDDLSDLPQAEREAKARWLAQDEAQTPFDLATGPLIRARLLRLSDSEHVVLLTVHHIVSDGWSAGVLVKEVAVLYGAFVQQQPSPLPELPVQYADFAHWQRQWLSGEVLQQQLDYWQGHLAGAPALLTLPTDRPRPAQQSHRGAMLPFALSAAATAGLNALSRQAKSTLFMTLTAAFNVLLSRYAGQDDICIGTPIANRNRAETEGLIGFFVNTLVLRTQVDSDASFLQLLDQVRGNTLDAYANQDVPFEQLVDVLKPERHLSHSPLFQVMLVLQNAPMEQLNLPGLVLHAMGSENTVAKFDLTLSLVEREHGLYGGFEYNTDLFDSTTIARMGDHFARLLDAIVAAPDRKVGELELFGEAERIQLLEEWNDTACPPAPAQTIDRLFEQQAERSPQALAVVYEGSELSYGELDERANRLAHYLREQGVGPEVLVGLYVERSLEMIVGLLAILKAGGAYLPLDPAYPQERIGYMLADAKPLLLLTQQHLAGSIPASGIPHFCLDTQWPAVQDLPASSPAKLTGPENLAYVIYTSGSTGAPKGVLLKHRGLCNLHRIQERTFGALERHRVLQFASFGFDGATFEIFMALGFGATLYLCAKDKLLLGPVLVRTLKQLKITTLALPPSALNAVDLDAELQLERLLLVGEACPKELVDKWAGKYRVFNGYGPTEATVATTAHVCQAGAPAAPPIGKPIDNVRVYVLGKDLQPVPVGAIGELFIAGESLGRGYLNRPELTADKFRPDPFGAQPGARMYASGDLARYTGDGTLECVGRVDSQVKLRGFRVELGEIEACIRAQAGVHDAAVLVHREASEAGRLVAYVVPAESSEELNLDALRKALGAALPDYMVPAHFMRIEAMPMTAHGKLDRLALPAPDFKRESANYVAPSTATQQKVAAIWQELLKFDKVGIHDNFFELGGHSLLAVQLLNRISRECAVAIPLEVIFKSQTVFLVAQYIDEFNFARQAKPLTDAPVEGNKRVRI
ncbi:non-ribosomal peptide synthetase [Duganella sp. HH101]|uniref:non-ribosomal peptide synthetase n=1 Tax=Duganella sp. HH101 TaxID=1781066 RepID=UPI0009F58AF1|nr:non-ribosomal peptide synthetase [Duganella sp. HH101]